MFSSDKTVLRVSFPSHSRVTLLLPHFLSLLTFSSPPYKTVLLHPQDILSKLKIWFIIQEKICPFLKLDLLHSKKTMWANKDDQVVSIASE